MEHMKSERHQRIPERVRDTNGADDLSAPILISDGRIHPKPETKMPLLHCEVR